MYDRTLSVVVLSSTIGALYSGDFSSGSEPSRV